MDGKTYHQACFKCGSCDRQIENKYCKQEDCYFCEPCSVAQSPQCGACGLPIFTEHTTDMDGVPFHHECFCCATCTSPISGAFGRRYSDGHVTCTLCKARERPQCTRCCQPLMGQHLTVNDEFFHPECFTCADCEQHISGAHYKRGADFLCKCCEDARAPQCGRCSKAIWTEHPTANGLPFHPECFLCTGCDGQISGSFFPNAAGHPTCQRCHEGHAPQCRGCEKPVFGDRISVRGHLYHSHCFACDDCGQGLVGTDGTAQCWQRESRHHCKVCHDDSKASPACAGCVDDVEECYKVQAKEDQLTSERVKIDCASPPALITGSSFEAFAAPEHSQRDVLVYSPCSAADRRKVHRKQSCDLRLRHDDCASSASTSVGSINEDAPSDTCSEDTSSPLRSEKGFSFSSTTPAALQRCKSSTILCATGGISVSTLQPAFAVSAAALLNPKASTAMVTDVGSDLNSSLLIRCLQAEWREIEKDQKIKHLEAQLRRLENRGQADSGSEEHLFAKDADLDSLCAKSDALLLQMSKTVAREELAYLAPCALKRRCSDVSVQRGTNSPARITGA